MIKMQNCFFYHNIMKASDFEEKGVREYYSITDLTREFHLTTRTLRFYEDEGLLQPLRRGRTRLYSQADHNRLQHILQAKRLNFSLAEIAEILKLYDNPPTESEPLRQMIEKTNKKRAMLKQMRQDIDDMMHEMDRIEEICFEHLAELGVKR